MTVDVRLDIMSLITDSDSESVLTEALRLGLGCSHCGADPVPDRDPDESDSELLLSDVSVDVNARPSESG